MKRIIFRAVALLLVCAVLCAPAMAFTDDTDIGKNYKDAVKDMAQSGVLDGFPDGSFKPQQELSREQGAKIVAYMILGKDKADALTSNKAIYSDVAADRWSAPYIAWCTGRGILHGYGDGLFGPGDKLTGRQFTKMLLCALGLGESSRYINDGWADRVSADAKALGLFAGDSAMNSDKPLKRQQAALLAVNAQTAAEAAALTPSGGGSTPSGGGSTPSGGGSTPSGGGSTPSGGGSTPSGGGTPTDDEELPFVGVNGKGEILLPEVP